MKLCIFPDEPANGKWSEYTINCNEQTLPIMQEIIKKTSLIRLSELQSIEKILAKVTLPIA